MVRREALLYRQVGTPPPPPPRKEGHVGSILVYTVVRQLSSRAHLRDPQPETLHLNPKPTLRWNHQLLQKRSKAQDFVKSSPFGSPIS